MTNYLRASSKSNLSNISYCWSIKGKVQKFLYTDYHQDIEINDKLYVSGKLIDSSSIEKTSGTEKDNYEFSCVFDDKEILSEAIINGEFDQGYVELLAVDAENKTIISKVHCGYIDEVKLDSFGNFHFNIVSLSSRLSAEIIDVYSPYCRASLGDSKCGVNIENYLFEAVIDSVSQKENYICVSKIPDSLRIYRKIIVDNKPYKILRVIGKRIYVQENLRSEIQKGFKVLFRPECDKRFSTCCEFFNNAVNYRAEPNIPGVDKLLKVAGR